MHAEAHHIDPMIYRKALGHFATGVTVITTVHEGEIHGMTANAFCSVSLKPPLVLVSVDQKNHTHDLLAQSGFYGVNVLNRHQERYSWHFGGKLRQGIQVPFVWQGDCPLLEEALVHLVCRTIDAHPAGDHTLYIAQVEYVHYTDEHAPLIFYSGTYQDIEEKLPEAPLFMYDPSLW